MKKNIISLSLILLGLFVFAACDDVEGELYKKTEGAIEASFPSAKASYEMLAEDGNKIVVELWRGDSQGSASVPVTITDNTDGVFVAEKNQFDFADGESKAYLAFNYPSIDDFGGEVYKLTLEVAEEMASHSGITKLEVTAQRKLTYNSIGKGLFYTNFFVSDEPWEVEVLKAEEADYYILVEPYWPVVEGFNIVFQVIDGKIYFDQQPMGYLYEGTSMVHWLQDSDSSTFDGKTFSFNPYFYVPDLGGGFGEIRETLVLK